MPVSIESVWRCYRSSKTTLEGKHSFLWAMFSPVLLLFKDRVLIQWQGNTRLRMMNVLKLISNECFSLRFPSLAVIYWKNSERWPRWVELSFYRLLFTRTTRGNSTNVWCYHRMLTFRVWRFVTKCIPVYQIMSWWKWRHGSTWI